MAVRTYQIGTGDIRNERTNRFDAKYYAVNGFFGRLAKTGKVKVLPLKDLSSDIKSGSYVAGYVPKDCGIPYLRVVNVKPFSLNENDTDLVYVSPDVDEKIRILKNDILLARTQATFDKLGTASIADDTNGNWATSQHTTRIRVNEKKISPYYLAAYMNSKFFKAQTALASYGSTRVEFTHSQLRKVCVFIPERELYESVIRKVEEIVGYNRAADNLIDEAKETLRRAISIDTGDSKSGQLCFGTSLSRLTEFDIWNATFHIPSLAGAENELRTKFRTVKLGEIAEITRGDEVGSDNYDVFMNKSDADYAFCRTSDIINYEIDLFPDYFVPKQVHDTLCQDLRPSDILFTKDGKIGQTALVTDADRAIISSGVARVRTKENGFNITPEYLFAVLSLRETGYNPAIRRTVGTTVPHLSSERLEQIAIPILDKCVIDGISEKINAAFKLKSKRKCLINNVLDEINGIYDYLYKTVSLQ